MKKKIKVFLGAYINQSNAQNLVCLTLAKNLNKEKFEVFTLLINHGNFGKIKLSGVNTFNCYYPVKLTQFLGYLWGIFNCDVAYLPRGNNFRYQKVLLKLFNKKSFKTTDNIIDEESLLTALAIFPNLQTVYDSYTFTDKLFAITDYMKKYNTEKHGFKYATTILPAPTDIDSFRFKRNEVEQVKEVVFMGNDMKRKGVIDFLNLALDYKSITFHVIGKDENKIAPKFMHEHNSENIILHGLLNYSQISEILKTCQLHILPSRSEGFPMAIIITAASSIPSLTYTGYGAEEWIDNYKNGVVCTDFSDMKVAFNSYINNQSLLFENMQNASAMAEKFSPQSVTKLYENVIIDLYNA